MLKTFFFFNAVIKLMQKLMSQQGYGTFFANYVLRFMKLITVFNNSGEEKAYI